MYSERKQRQVVHLYTQSVSKSQVFLFIKCTTVTEAVVDNKHLGSQAPSKQLSMYKIKVTQMKNTAFAR